MNFAKSTVIPLLLLVLPLGVYGETLATSSDSKTSLSFNVGMMSGEAGEFVYDADGSASGIEGYKISELQWELSNVIMTGFGVRHQFNDRFALGANYMFNAIEGDGYMTDFDWLYVGLPWSHRSKHPDTSVFDVTRLDISGDLLLHHSEKNNADIYALFGYRQDHIAWQADGGTAIYSTPGFFRDVYGVFADIPVISYEQTYKTPYIGFGLRASNVSEGKRISLDFRTRFSRWVQGEDEDIHHLRDLQFNVSGDGGEWLDMELVIDAELSEKVNMTFGVTYSQYGEIKGPTDIKDLTTGVVTTYPGESAGLEYSTTLWSLGFSYQL